MCDIERMIYILTVHHVNILSCSTIVVIVVILFGEELVM